MTFEEQVHDEYDKLNNFIHNLEQETEILGYQSGNPSLIMKIEGERFMTGYTHLDLTPALTIIKFKYERQREIQRGERYKYWFGLPADIDEIINSM